MVSVIDASVVAGTLKLDQGVDLPDNIRVRITVEAINEDENALAA